MVALPTSRADLDIAAQTRLDHAMERLRSFHDGDAALLEVVGLGPDAIPALRDLLFTREPSGLFQSRCRAVEALALLKGFSVLADFLRLRRDPSDPVERLGEDAVKSAAGRALARLREPWVYELLLALANERPLLGILAGVGSFLHDDSIPIFVAALGEDDLRLTAHGILLSFGKTAWSALIAAALDRGEDQRAESESHLRKRRSALVLLLDGGISRRSWSKLRDLMDDRDLQVALLTCELCVEIGSAQDRTKLCRRLNDLRTSADWSARERIDKLSKAAECDQR